MATTRRRVLWSAGFAGRPLQERVDAAVANGFDVVSVSTADHQQIVAEGGSPGDMAKQAADAGVELAIIDGLVEWFPHEPSKHLMTSSSMTIDDVLAMAADFGVQLVNAIAPFKTALTTEGLAERFAVVCDKAADHGMKVHFEFTPRSPVADVGTAWELCRLADRPNAGILFDTWHFYRTNPDFDDLAAVPDDRIYAVQVSDGKPDFVEGLLQDTFRHRLLPGDGDFDLARVLRALDAKGCLTYSGPEVLAVELFELPAMENAKLVGEAYDRVVTAAVGAA